MKALPFAVLIAFIFQHLPAQDSSTNYSEAFSLIEIWLDAQKDYENLPGITATVVSDQKQLWSAGFGMANRENGIAAKPTTLFSICSISKLFTSVAIMKLLDDGKLRLDDEVDDLLPWYNLKQKYPNSGPITIRSLMTHSSGLPREAATPYWTGPDFPFPSQDVIKSKLGQQETLYPSSTYFQYSNLGLTLLGEIIEEVSGQEYSNYIQENILQPLGLSNTRTEMPESLHGTELAIGYSASKRDGKRDEVILFNANGITPAAGFSSTVEDLGKFASWQFRLLETQEQEILKSSTLDYMQRVHWIDPDWETTWGLGFSIGRNSSGETVVGHGGSCPGYRSTLTIEPENKMAVSVMINAGGTNPSKYASGIRQIMKKMNECEKADTSATKNESLELADYLGHYDEQPWSGEVYVGNWEGNLVLLELPSNDPAESMVVFRHMEGDTFQRIRDNKDLGESLVFERNQRGEVFRMKRHGNYANKIVKP